jgi:hypothetical protein
MSRTATILKHLRLAGLLTALAALACFYGGLAYLALPAAWAHYEHQKGLEGLPMVTRTPQHIPGDPINVGLVGDRADVLCAMHAAGWSPADPVTFRSSMEIIGSVLLDRAYPDAPVSKLLYMGRPEDLAFEKLMGRSARRRHHVRLWSVLGRGEEGRPVWLGAATFDRGVGLSRYTGAVTHRIAPDIDAERGLLANDLVAASVVAALYQIQGVGPTFTGRNGGGDRYYTDGEVQILRLVMSCRKRSEPPLVLASPPMTEIKNAVWHGVANAIGD